MTDFRNQNFSDNSQQMSPEGHPQPFPAPPQGPSNFQAPPSPPVQKKSSSFKAILISLLLGLTTGSVLGGLSSYMLARSQQKSWAQAQERRLNKAQERAKAQTSSYIRTYYGRSDYTWNLAALASLDYQGASQQGLTADQLVETFGLASKQYYKAGQLELHWGDSATYGDQHVNFYFKKEGGQFYLVSADLLSPLQEYSGFLKGNSNSKMPLSYFDQLEQGDLETGQGGTSLKSVLKAYSRPTEFKIYSEQDAAGTYKSDRVIARLIYQVGQDSETLIFLRQDDGDFAYIGFEEE